MRFKGLFESSARKAPAVIVAAAVLGFAGAALADGGGEHRLEQSLPIVLGSSGGNINNFGQDGNDRIFCCGGTLGAMVQAEITGDLDPELFILSNNHVLARVNQHPILSFTSVNPLVIYFDQENIIQPGLIDQGQDTNEGVCTQDASETVANLTDFVQIHFDDEDEFNNSPVNRVDAAIARVVTGRVSEEILDIGQVSTTTVPMSEALNMRVKKSGRTTGLTNGKVRAINVTSNVGYTDECGDGVVRSAYFVDQILVWGGGFSAGGDSGSLIVERVDVAPRPVGLLFAGSTVATIINPIDTVLDELSAEIGSPVSMVGASGGTIVPPPDEEEDSGGPPPGRGGGRFLSGDGPFGLEVASAVKERHEDRLFDIPGVVGTGISVDDDGNPVIEIYVERATRAAGRPIPQALEGVPVRVIETGRFIAY